MYDGISLSKEGAMRKQIVALVLALPLLFGGVAPLAPSVHAAPWLSSAKNYGSTWVKDIEQEFNKQEYRSVFSNDPRTPQKFPWSVS